MRHFRYCSAPPAIIALFRVANRYVGNLPPMPGVFPDYPAPVVRNVGAERELTMMRWGIGPVSENPLALVRKNFETNVFAPLELLRCI